MLDDAIVILRQIPKQKMDRAPHLHPQAFSDPRAAMAKIGEALLSEPRGILWQVPCVTATGTLQLGPCAAHGLPGAAANVCATRAN